MKYLYWFDMIVFSLMLVISALIGLYFAYFAPVKQNTTLQYLMGGKSMSVFPIGMSLIASYISGITLLGLPTEMYVYGTQYSMVIIPEALVCISVIFIHLPVFYKLQITTSYEVFYFVLYYIYLRRRFSTSVKLFGSCIFVLRMMLYIPIVIYVPALAFSQVTGINLHLVSPAVCLICILYTSLGGLKAVVWADTFQMIVMLLGIVAVLALGLMKIGIGTVYERSKQSERLEFFNISLDPTTRHTIWSVVIGNYFHWMSSLSTNQAMVQRCLALPNLREARIALMMLAVGIVILVVLCGLTGLVIYATFYDCDPISTKIIRKPDQLVPLYVLQIAETIPGLSGIFLSGVFSAALSTMSTGLNSMTGVIFEDVIRPMYKNPVSESDASFIMKIIVVVIGVICVMMVFIVEQLGTLIQAGTSLSGITAGPLLGIFSLGMFLPWINHKGALIGGITSLCTVAWISLNAQKEIALGNIVFPAKPLSIDGCDMNLKNNSIFGSSTTHFTRDPFILYKLSYLWYALIGTVITCVVGIIVSCISGFNDPKEIDIELLTPLVQKWFMDKRKTDVEVNEAQPEQNHKTIISSNGLEETFI